VKIDAMAAAMNPNRRRLAEALAFPKNESSISPENL
jgi:hypothetical protein